MTTKGPKQKRKKTVVLLAVICGVLLVGCLGCLAIGSLAPDEPMATPTVLATATPEPEIVGPTSTSIPTHTPRPTAVPTSAPTSTPQPTIDNTSNYREQMYLLLVQYTETQKTVAELNRQGANDSSLLFDSQWKTDMALALSQALTIGREIRELEAPQEFQETHSCLVKSTEHYDAFVDLYARGVDSLDASLIVQGGGELTLATEWMNKAVETMP